jgi:MFS family permease
MAAIVTPPRFVPLYLSFAGAYLLSYVYRTVNAVISPELSAALGVSASSLGLLTSAYFIAFAAMQVPAGMLLDRYGPRRVEPILLFVAGCGALGFASGEHLGSLVAARALIGVGVSVCLMAPLKAIATWYAPERQGSLSGWIMVAGGLGVLASSAPLAAALTVMSWRAIFVVLAAATFVAALAILLLVPDIPGKAQGQDGARPWAGVQRVFRSARFWWIAPISMASSGSFMAIQGLWSVPWLMEVDGYSRAAAANHLLLVGIVILTGYLALGFFATALRRQGIDARHIFAAGFGLHLVMLFVMVGELLPWTYLVWALYGLGSAVNVLGFSVLNEGFPRQLTARANTALNLLMFTGSFAMQAGIGLAADAARAWLGTDAAGGLRVAFTIVAIVQALAYVWFMLGWRRHSASAPAGAAA